MSTPISDRIAAVMTASDGDRHYAEGAGYRRGGFDVDAWMASVNAQIAHGYQVRRLEARYAPDTHGLYDVSGGGRERLLSKRILPEEMSARVINEMVALYGRAVNRGVGLEYERLRRAKAQPRYSAPEIEDLDIDEAPGMRP